MAAPIVQAPAFVNHFPAHSTLYESRFEHDACGVGMVCRIDGIAEHKVVADALQVLQNLEHRGACGCDPDSGDGAGILLQIPHLFFKEELEHQGIELGKPGDYAVGVMFIPPAALDSARSLISDVFALFELSLLGWRRVPVESICIGSAARSTEPEMWQVFVKRPDSDEQGLEFERRLFLARRMLESRSRRSDELCAEVFHVASFSSRTIVYKGMLTTDQLRGYFPDLWDTRMESAVCLVHSRFSTNTLPQWDLAHPFRYLCHNGEINTLRGNANWMKARESLFETDLFGPHLDLIRPVLTEGAAIPSSSIMPWSCSYCRVVPCLMP